jgi:hypothetical protein
MKYGDASAVRCSRKTVILSAAKNLAWIATEARFFAALRMTVFRLPHFSFFIPPSSFLLPPSSFLIPYPSSLLPAARRLATRKASIMLPVSA